MKIIQTKNQVEMSKYPTRFEILRELNKRKALDKDLEAELHRLKMGYMGEQTVLRYLEEFGNEDWVVIPNLWLEYYGIFECDLLLVTPCGLYAFEIKNYSGKFEFHNNQCLINGVKVGHNPITQTQKMSLHLKNILQNVPIRVNIQGVLVFIGQHNDVVIHDPLEEIHVVTSNQLRDYIMKIAADNRNVFEPSIDTTKILEAFENIEKPNPFNDLTLPNEIKANAQRGICCSHCGNFDLKMSKSYITCGCGIHEPRENAIVRTICEYGVIHYDKELVTTELVDFFGGDIHKKTLLKYLNLHFKRIGTTSNTEFKNLRLSFNNVYENFELNDDIFMQLGLSAYDKAKF